MCHDLVTLQLNVCNQTNPRKTDKGIYSAQQQFILSPLLNTSFKEKSQASVCLCQGKMYPTSASIDLDLLVPCCVTNK